MQVCVTSLWRKFHIDDYRVEDHNVLNEMLCAITGLSKFNVI